MAPNIATIATGDSPRRNSSTSIAEPTVARLLREEHDDLVDPQEVMEMPAAIAGVVAYGLARVMLSHPTVRLMRPRHKQPEAQRTEVSDAQ
jgi:hypothetical protein